MAAVTTAPPEDSGADDRLPAAKEEARALFGLVERGSSTAQAVRKLIEVSPADEERIRAFAKTEPQFAHCMLPVLRFQKRVMREFERLVAIGKDARICKCQLELGLGRPAVNRSHLPGSYLCPKRNHVCDRLGMFLAEKGLFGRNFVSKR